MKALLALLVSLLPLISALAAAGNPSLVSFPSVSIHETNFVRVLIVTNSATLNGSPLLTNAPAPTFAQVTNALSLTGDTTKFLDGSGALSAPPGSAVTFTAVTNALGYTPLTNTVTAVTERQTNIAGANPTATVGTSAVNGSAGTFMRSDAAPAIPAAFITANQTNVTLASLGGAPLASPAFTGTPTINGSPILTNAPDPTFTQVTNALALTGDTSQFLNGAGVLGVPPGSAITFTAITNALGFTPLTNTVAAVTERQTNATLASLGGQPLAATLTALSTNTVSGSGVIDLKSEVDLKQLGSLNLTNWSALSTNLAVSYVSVTNALSLSGSTATFVRSDGTQATPPAGSIPAGFVSNNVASAGLLSVDATKTNGIAATAAHITAALGYTPLTNSAAAVTALQTNVTLVSIGGMIASTALTNLSNGVGTNLTNLLSGDVSVLHPDGTTTAYSAASNTDAARGTALTNALAAAVTGDVIRLGPNTFDIGANALDLGLAGTGTVHLRGCGMKVSVIKSALAIGSGAIVLPGSGSIVEHLSIIGNAVVGTTQILWGASGGGNAAFANAFLRYCYLNALSDGVYCNVPSCSGTIIGCVIDSNFDTVRIAANGGAFTFYDCTLTTVANATFPHTSRCFAISGAGGAATQVTIHNCSMSAGGGDTTDVCVLADSCTVNVYGGDMASSGTGAFDLKQASTFSTGVLNVNVGTVYTTTSGTITQIPVPGTISFASIAATNSITLKGAAVLTNITSAQVTALQTNVAAANPTATVATTAVNGTAGTFMRSDASPAIPASLITANQTNVVAANPTASVSGSAVNGTAGTFMRSDAAPALASVGTAGTYILPTITTDAQGRVTAATTAILYESSTVVNATSSSTASNVVSFSIAGNTLGTNHSVAISIQGDFLQNLSGPTNLTLTLKYGATALWTSTLSIVASANRKPFTLAANLYGINSTASQGLDGTFLHIAGGAATAGVGPLTSAPAAIIAASFDGATASEDSTAAKTFLLTSTWASASANCEFKVKRVVATLE